MEFRYSKRLIRFVFLAVVSIALSEPYGLISDKYIPEGFISSVLEFVCFCFALKITGIIVVAIENKFPFFTRKGSCHVEKDMLVLHLGNKTYECSTKDGIENLIYMEDKGSKWLIGTDWDTLKIRMKEKTIVLMAKPNEKEAELANKELYKLFLLIRDECNLVKVTDTYFDECYRAKC